MKTQAKLSAKQIKDATKEMKALFTDEQVRDITEAVYRMRLEDDCTNNVRWMLEKDAEKDPNDNGKKLRGRSVSYLPTIKACITALIANGVIKGTP